MGTKIRNSSMVKLIKEGLLQISKRNLETTVASGGEVIKIVRMCSLSTFPVCSRLLLHLVSLKLVKWSKVNLMGIKRDGVMVGLLSKR